MTRVCTICGTEFESARNNLTCSNECFAELKNKRKKEQREKYHEEKNKANKFMSQNMKEIERICVEANQAGMSYGNYVARNET